MHQMIRLKGESSQSDRGHGEHRAASLESELGRRRDLFDTSADLRSEGGRTPVPIRIISLTTRAC